jgi:hypothetical protein
MAKAAHDTRAGHCIRMKEVAAFPLRVGDTAEDVAEDVEETPDVVVAVTSYEK